MKIWKGLHDEIQANVSLEYRGFLISLSNTCQPDDLQILDGPGGEFCTDKIFIREADQGISCTAENIRIAMTGIDRFFADEEKRLNEGGES